MVKKLYPIFIAAFCQFLFAVNSIAQTDTAASQKSHYVALLAGITTGPSSGDFVQVGGGYYGGPNYYSNYYSRTAPVFSIGIVQDGSKRTGKTIALNYYYFIKVYATLEDTVIVGGTLDTNFNVVGGTKYYDRSRGHLNLLSLEFLFSTRLLKPGKKFQPVVNYGINSTFINVTKTRGLSYPDGVETILEGPFNSVGFGITLGVGAYYHLSERLRLMVDAKSHIPGAPLIGQFSRPGKSYGPWYGSIYSVQAGVGYRL